MSNFLVYLIQNLNLTGCSILLFAKGSNRTLSSLNHGTEVESPSFVCVCMCLCLCVILSQEVLCMKNILKQKTL